MEIETDQSVKSSDGLFGGTCPGGEGGLSIFIQHILVWDFLL